MSILRKGLLATVSGLAMLSGFAADKLPPAPRAPTIVRPFGERPTPRKPERLAAFPAASLFRAKKRQEARNAYFKQLRKEREIGIDPIYVNGLDRAKREFASSDWRGRSRAWDAANSKKVV